MADPLRIITVTLPEGTAPRLDKALADAAPEKAALSRSRIRALIEAGAVSRGGEAVRDPKAKVAPGSVWQIALPETQDVAIVAQDIPLNIVFEDDDLIVVDKPAGMVVHPAPGAEDGTLVNALLHHFGGNLSGIGGEKRPGIVHRIDKDTSGLLVVAKSDAAHQGLSAQFAAHDLDRHYRALVWGEPSPIDPRLRGIAGVSFEGGGIIRIDAPIARHRTDRKRMAVVSGGRRAVTRCRVLESFGDPEKPVASLVDCWLETGRTHQIRVHMTHIGHSLIGDPVYGSKRAIAKSALDEDARDALRGFPRQALHAAVLGFEHPVSGTKMRFESPLPDDFAALLSDLKR